jgi:hypothetical protein
MSETYKELYSEDMPSEAPGFGFPLVAKALEPLLTQMTKNAVVLGIHGPWGSGKTTLMGSLRRQLEQSPSKHLYIFIDFNAWKFQDKQALWRALILHTLGQLRVQVEKDAFDNADDGKKLAAIEKRRKKLDELEESLYRTFAVEEKGPWKINWRSVFVELLGVLLSAIKLDFVGSALKESTGWFGRMFFGKKEKNEEDGLINKSRVDELAKVFERTTIERHVAQVQSVEQFLGEFKKLAEGLSEDGRRVFVFVDDLDRCLPESALEIFEAIKLFLDAPGFAYVVALDRDVIRKALDVRYSRSADLSQGQRFISADQYIEKTISVSFDAPRLSKDDALAIISDAKLPLTLSDANKGLIVKGLGTNPRRVKRFMNTLALHLNLAQVANEAGLVVHAALLDGGDSKSLNVFIKLLIISYRYSGVFSLALDDEDLLGRLQEASNHYRAKVQDSKAEEGRVERNKKLDEETPLISALRNDEEFWALMATDPRLTDAVPTVAQLRNWFRAGVKAAGP